MVFVEVFRLLVVVLGAVAGLQAGEHVHHSGWAPLTGVFLGAAVTYVVGGIAGRVVDHGITGALAKLRRIPAAEVLAATVVGTGGLLLGLALGLPAMALVRSPLVLPAAGVLAWVLCVLGVRLGASKGRDVARAAGIAHLLDPRLDRQLGGTLVVDASALMDHHLEVLGRSGLLTGGLAVPRSVVDEVRMLADSPDERTARKAGRALDALVALKDADVAVTVVADQPGAVGPVDQVVSVARRLGGRLVSSTPAALDAARAASLPVVDLRSLVADLVPEHPVGEQLVVDLVRPGRLARQAVGYLADGAMVVVNDAEDLIGRGEVLATVEGTRRTTQGRLVFGRLQPGLLGAATAPSSVATPAVPVSPAVSVSVTE